MNNKKYLSAAETAKIVRGQLTAHFPGIKFYVRSETYSGGASIHITWIDGPSTKAVDKVAKQYEGADFDGMIDLKTYVTHWLLPNGSIVIKHAEGTQDAHGYKPEIINEQPDGAVEVHFGADYIFTNRLLTPEYAKPIIKKLCEERGISEPKYFENHPFIGKKQREDITVIDWDSRDLEYWDSQELWKRLNGEEEALVPEKVEETIETAEKIVEAAGPDTVKVYHDRDWTWIEVPAKDDAALRPILIEELKARWSFRRSAYFITQTIDETLVFAKLEYFKQEPAPVREVPNRFLLGLE